MCTFIIYFLKNDRVTLTLVQGNAKKPKGVEVRVNAHKKPTQTYV